MAPSTPTTTATTTTVTYPYWDCIVAHEGIKNTTTDWPCGQRYGSSSVICNDSLYIFGGCTFGGCISGTTTYNNTLLDELWCFNLKSSFPNWKKIQYYSSNNSDSHNKNDDDNNNHDKPAPRRMAGLTVLNSTSVGTRLIKRLYLFGGEGSKGVRFNDLWEFDIESRRWKCLQESSEPLNDNNNKYNSKNVHGRPLPSFASAFFSYNDKLFVFGGNTGINGGDCDLHSYNIQDRTWTRIGTNRSFPNQSGRFPWTTFSNNFYFYSNTEKIFYTLDLDTFHWKSIHPRKLACPAPDVVHTICMVNDNEIYAFASRPTGVMNVRSLYCYTLDTREWVYKHALEKNIQAFPNGASMMVIQPYEGIYIYMFGGLSHRDDGRMVTPIENLYCLHLFPIHIPLSVHQTEFMYLVNNPKKADIRFLVNDVEFYGHSLILTTRSKYFERMLDGNMREGTNNINASNGNSHDDDNSNSNNNNNKRDYTTISTDWVLPIIQVGDVTPQAFRQVLEYLYTFEYPKTFSTDLLIASDIFMLDRLRTMCEMGLCKTMSVETACTTLSIAYRHNATGLVEYAIDYILQNARNSTIVSNIETLPAEILAKLFRLKH